MVVFGVVDGVFVGFWCCFGVASCFCLVFRGLGDVSVLRVFRVYFVGFTAVFTGIAVHS